MCGIVGYVGNSSRKADHWIQALLTLWWKGCARLEYRGYDSAGVAVVADGSTVLVP
jgi:glucosamine--fructose-6-phosphate aminotransferase (isomerizing)